MCLDVCMQTWQLEPHLDTESPGSAYLSVKINTTHNPVQPNAVETH